MQNDFRLKIPIQFFKFSHEPARASIFPTGPKMSQNELIWNWKVSSISLPHRGLLFQLGAWTCLNSPKLAWIENKWWATMNCYLLLWTFASICVSYKICGDLWFSQVLSSSQFHEILRLQTQQMAPNCYYWLHTKEQENIISLNR